jgi:hypothetical protein
VLARQALHLGQQGSQMGRMVAILALQDEGLRMQDAWALERCVGKNWIG